ncbi:hypothetical protein GCM10009546_61710 [Actinomadura livida]|uniref:Uncharacterized protein n=1 Tax=Actinomadura livida TaxID=79909 RepID=A0ABN1FHP9_9ACTN|nr:hypothetical protein GCM10010208_69780 [Actinomadura livida]
MNAHLSDSDRQALRLAQDLREEMRAALPHLPSAPSVSPFVDQAGMPSVLLRMDADTARALMALLAERRLEQGSAEPRRGDGTHIPPAAQAVPAAQGAVAPFGQHPPYPDPAFAPPHPAPPVFTGGTGPTPLVPSVYPTH